MDYSVNGSAEESASPDVGVTPSPVSSGVPVITSLWSYWAGLNFGSPSGNGYKPPGLGLTLGADRIVKHDFFKAGVFLSSVTADAEQSFTYDITGYTEVFHYKVNSTAFGGRMTFVLGSGVQLVGDVGVGYTTSQISSITTDGPAVVGAPSGQTKNSGWDSIYAVALQKEWKSDHIGYGVELGQMVRGSKTNDGIKQTYLQIFASYQ